MEILTEQNKHLPCVTNKAYEITLFLMFNREFMNDVYRTFSIISRGLRLGFFIFYFFLFYKCKDAKQ
nr:MAG TPA: hypothetical protein [Caudoviricetes sp.]